MCVYCAGNLQHFKLGFNLVSFNIVGSSPAPVNGFYAMNDFQRILTTLEKRNEPCVLATVVHTEGSTYRRAGARLLVFADNTSVGAISGGCLESDVVERSQRVLQTGTPAMVVYDGSSDDPIFGLGMGCNGITTVFLERLAGADDPFCTFLRHCFRERERGAIATVYEIERTKPHETVLEGHRFFLYTNEEASDNFGESAFATQLRDAIWNHATEALTAERTYEHRMFDHAEAKVHILIECLQPIRELVIAGAGYDALPLVEYATLLGWRTTVLDHRPALLSTERFPKASMLTRITRENIAETARHLAFSAQTALVVMTHNLAFDAALLREAFASKARYIGLLGPKPRLEKIFALLEEQGFTPTDDDRARLHNPIGLDIGTETAEEVALSIIAEIQAVMSARSGGFLKKRKQKKIH